MYCTVYIQRSPYQMLPHPRDLYVPQRALCIRNTVLQRAIREHADLWRRKTGVVGIPIKTLRRCSYLTSARSVHLVESEAQRFLNSVIFYI